jgi:hypothetical protein
MKRGAEECRSRNFPVASLEEGGILIVLIVLPFAKGRQPVRK